MDSRYLIEHLQLTPHPEGGFYRRIYESGQSIHFEGGQSRRQGSAIYYLLTDEEKSRFHRLDSDELWFFHQGQPIKMLLLEEGNIKTVLLGNNLKKGETPQFAVPANTWFAAHIKNGKGYALVSCTVIPEFTFENFELADRAILLKEYPRLKEIIVQFT